MFLEAQEETSNLLKYDGEAVIKQFLSVLDDLGRLESASAFGLTFARAFAFAFCISIDVQIEPRMCICI